MTVTADDHLDVGRELAGNRRDRAAEVDAAVRIRRFVGHALLAAFVNQQDHGADALLLPEPPRVLVGGRGFIPEGEAGGARGRDDLRRALQRFANEPDFDPVDRPDGGGGKQRPSGGGVDDVGGKILKSRAGKPVAAPAAVDGMAASPLQPLQFPRTAIELVVADRRQRQSHRVQRFDGRLVVKQPRNQRRRTDEIAGGDDDRVRLLLDEALEMRGQVFGAAGRRLTDASVAAGRRFEVAVKIVEGEKLDGDGRIVSARPLGGQGQRDRQQGDRQEQSADHPSILTSSRHLLKPSLK